MKLSNRLSHAAASPRSTSLVPRYPRHAILLAALSLAGCAGGARTTPAQTVSEPNASNDHAQPPSESPPPPAEPPEDEVVPLAGVAPEPFEP